MINPISNEVRLDLPRTRLRHACTHVTSGMMMNSSNWIVLRVTSRGVVEFWVLKVPKNQQTVRIIRPVNNRVEKNHYTAGLLSWIARNSNVVWLGITSVLFDFPRRNWFWIRKSVAPISCQKQPIRLLRECVIFLVFIDHSLSIASDQTAVYVDCFEIPFNQKYLSMCISCLCEQNKTQEI